MVGVVFLDDDDVYDQCRLTVYTGVRENDLMQLDTQYLDTFQGARPSVDHYTGKIYIADRFRAVGVFWYDGTKLLELSSLICISAPGELAVVSRDELYVCDSDDRTVSLVDVNKDRVTAKLIAPDKIGRQRPDSIAVVGETLLVSYIYPELNLVIYRHGIPTPGKMVPRPQGLRSVTALSTDNHLCFLVTDGESNAVYVLDLSGKLVRVIPSPVNDIRDCIVVDGQLLLVNKDGVMMKLLP